MWEGALPYPPWACLLREIHDLGFFNKADRQVVTDRQTQIDAVMRTAEQTSVVHSHPSRAGSSQMIACLIDFIYV